MDLCPECGSLLENIGEFLCIWQCTQCGYTKREENPDYDDDEYLNEDLDDGDL